MKKISKMDWFINTVLFNQNPNNTQLRIQVLLFLILGVLNAINGVTWVMVFAGWGMGVNMGRLLERK